MLTNLDDVGLLNSAHEFATNKVSALQNDRLRLTTPLETSVQTIVTLQATVRKTETATYQVTERLTQQESRNSMLQEIGLLTIHAEGYSNLVLDMSQVNYVDSSGLSALLVGDREFGRNGGIFAGHGLFGTL